MESLTESQGRALAALVAEMRPEWGVAGVWAALGKARSRGTGWAVAHAALYCAADPAVRTPALIAEAGPHWTRGVDAPSPANVARCPMPGHSSFPAHACGSCRSEQLAADDELAAALLEQRQAGAPSEVHARGANAARVAAGLPVRDLP